MTFDLLLIPYSIRMTVEAADDPLHTPQTCSAYGRVFIPALSGWVTVDGEGGRLRSTVSYGVTNTKIKCS